MKSILIIPLCTTLIAGLTLWYVIGTPITLMTEFVTKWLQGLSRAIMAFLGMIIGGMFAFDMGGPINKITNAFILASFSEGLYGTITIGMLAISIPPAGIFLATSV